MKKLLFILSITLIGISLSAQKNFVTKANYFLTSKVDLAKAKENLDSADKYDINKESAFLYVCYGKYYFLKFQAEGLSENLINSTKNTMIALEKKDIKKFTFYIDAYINDLIQASSSAGVEGFNKKDFVAAYNGFNSVMLLKSTPTFKDLPYDTAMAYNTGLAAYNGKLYPEAVKYFKKTTELNFSVEYSIYLGRDACLANKDTIGAIEMLQFGFEKHPEMTSLLVDIVKLYIISNNKEGAIKYIQIGKEKAPNNKVLYFAEGIVYEQLNESVKAKASYQKAVELDPMYFEAYYNLGVLVFNDAVTVINYANSLKSDKEYKAEIAKGNDIIKEAIPYMEKALELKSEDLDVMDKLKKMYIRIRTEEPYKTKLEDLDKKISTIKGE